MVTNLFLRASQAMPGDADVLVALGVLHNLSSDYDRAIETFQRAATLRPQVCFSLSDYFKFDCSKFKSVL
jgi:hypothetical protein